MGCCGVLWGCCWDGGRVGRLVGPPGFHTTTREPKRAHLSVPVFKNTTKIQREDPQKEKKERNFRREREKKSEILGGPGKGGPAEGGPGERPKNLEHTHHTHQQQPTTTTNNHQQAPTGNNRHQQATTGNNQEQQATTRNNNNNNRKFGQNTKTPKLAKCGHDKSRSTLQNTKIGHGLAKVGQRLEVALKALGQEQSPAKSALEEALKMTKEDVPKPVHPQQRCAEASVRVERLEAALKVLGEEDPDAEPMKAALKQARIHARVRPVGERFDLCLQLPGSRSKWHEQRNRSETP